MILETYIRFLLKHSSTRFLLNILIPLIFWGFFLYRHITFFLTFGGWVVPVYILSHGILMTLFILRRVPQSVETHPRAWFWALAGTLAPSFLTPGRWWLTSAGELVVVLAVVIQILSILSLGRSFGVVAANRGIVTHGMYRIVRHPIYLAYFFYGIGYIMVFPSPVNIASIGTLFIATFFRIEEEEKFLKKDPAYAAYTQHVRWRLFPYIY